jgi:hypothetical protein
LGRWNNSLDDTAARKAEHELRGPEFIVPAKLFKARQRLTHLAPLDDFDAREHLESRGQ